MKPLFRRTYQSKTNCCCLSGGESLLCVRGLGKTAVRGFFLCWISVDPWFLLKDEGFFWKHHWASASTTLLGQSYRPGQCISQWRGGSWMWEKMGLRGILRLALDFSSHSSLCFWSESQEAVCDGIWHLCPLLVSWASSYRTSLPIPIRKFWCNHSMRSLLSFFFVCFSF